MVQVKQALLNNGYRWLQPSPRGNEFFRIDGGSKAQIRNGSMLQCQHFPQGHLDVGQNGRPREPQMLV